MKYRYMLFAMHQYYPSGGIKDLNMRFNTFDEFLGGFEDTFDFFDFCYQLVDTTNLSYDTLYVDYDDYNCFDAERGRNEGNILKMKNDIIKWVEQRVG